MARNGGGGAPFVGAPLPAGTVTFLFTDIEGSTRRWEHFPVEMARCVAEHDELLGDAVAAAGGTVVKSTGDGLMAVFDNADAALVSALAGQVALAGHNWSPVPALRVRMGIHQGRAEPIAGDYFGVPVNRAARLADCGHGGQIVVSAAAAGTMDPAPGVSLRSRGLHRLKDLSEPLELFQAIGPGSENELLPLRTVDVSRNHLPVQRTAFVGRQREVQRAAAVLDEGRLLTLCGLGGAGKTRLALHVAADVASRFADGAHFVDLSNARPGDDLAVIVAEQLTAPARAAPPPGTIDLLASELVAKQLLLVVDNCEHLLDPVASLLGRLLDRAGGVSCVVTSREPPRIAGEVVLRVEPFDVADDEDPAVELFVERARAASGAVIGPDDLSTVSALCGLIDRLLLAVELAAARTAHLPLAELHRRLQQHHGVLVSRERDRSDRHRTVEQLLSWSASLLSPEELALFARFTIFAGPVPLGAVEAVCASDRSEAADVLDVFSSLVDRSLVIHDPSSGTYRMLSLVRSFAADALAATADRRLVQHRY